MYIGSLTRGGAERVMVNLAEELFARGWKVTLVTTYLGDDEYGVPHGCWQRAADGGGLGVLNTDDRPAAVTFDGISGDKEISGHGVSGSETYIGRVFSGVSSAQAGSRPAAFVKRRKRLEEIWRELKPDVILSFIGKNNLMALMTARKYRIPVVVSVRAVPELEYPGKLMKTAADILFARAAAVVVQTKAAADFFAEKVRKRAAVVPNAVSREFTEDGASGPGTGDRETTVAAVGRMDANKRFDLLLGAFADIVKEGGGEENKYRLLLYGDGEDRKKLEELAGELGIAERTDFKGYRSDIAKQLRNAGMYCLMSDTEGMPNTLIEALCLGVPCITTDCIPGGIAQLVTDGEDALVIPAGDRAALGAAMKRIIGDHELAAKLSANGKKLREKYDPDNVTDIWENLLKGAVGK